MATLPPPPLTSPLTQRDGTTTSTWARWLSGLQALLNGTAATLRAPALVNSWANYGAGWQTAGFWLDVEGWVHIVGQVKDGASGTVAFVLPAGYRPAANMQFAIMYNNVFGYVTVEANGNVSLTVGGGAAAAFATLNGVSFPAAA